MGIDPINLPLHRFVALAYHLRVRNLDEKGRSKHDMDLYQAPPGEKKVAVPGQGRDREMSGFAAAMAANQTTLARVQ